MAETPTTSSSIPNEEELADDALLLFVPEHLDSSIDVLPQQPPAYVVTIRTSLPASESSSRAEPLPRPMPSSALNVTGGQHRGGEMVDRLWNLEAQQVALQTLYRLCTDIERRLGLTEDALHDLHDVAFTTTLQRACVEIENRLARTEDALQQSGEHAVELRMQIDTRLQRLENVLRRVHETVVENRSPKQLRASIDERPSRTEAAVHRMESLATDSALHQLSAHMDVRLAEAEDAIRRIERSVESADLHHLHANIDGRFRQAVDKLRRLESLLEARTAWTVGVQRVVVFSADVGRRARPVLHHAAAATAAIALAARQTIARTLLSAQRLATTLAAAGVDVARLQRAVRRCAPAVVLAAAMAVAAIVRNDPRIDTTAAAAVFEAKTVRPPATRTSVTASIAKGPMGALQFLGSLAIASEPPGATVFVDGQRVGVTPLELPASKAASLALQITRKGFQRWTAAIQVPAGQLTQVKVTLQPSAVTVPDAR